jgi:hypothetical protein
VGSAAPTAWEFEDFRHTGRVELTDGEVVVTKPSGRPAEHRYSWVQAFRDPRSLFIRDASVLHELVTALAARLEEEDLEHERDRARLRWWRHFDPRDLEDRNFSVPPRDHKGALVYELVGGVLLKPYPAESPDERKPENFKLADDVFFYGPEAIGLARETRVELRRHLLGAVGAEAGLTEGDGFPLLDHGRVPKRDWTWDVRDGGSSDAVLEGAQLMSGYQYRQDMGYSLFSVERALTDPPGQYLHVPAATEREIREILRGAVESG